LSELPQVIQSLEDRGVHFSVIGNSLRVSYACPSSELPKIKAALDRVRACKPQAIEILRRKQIPAGAILLAPRFDGSGRPLPSVPRCWCCRVPWKLERLVQWKGRTYAWLEPGCGCLDVPQALSCCGLCVEHCRCRVRKAGPETNAAPKMSTKDFRTPTGDGGGQ